MHLTRSGSPSGPPSRSWSLARGHGPMTSDGCGGRHRARCSRDRCRSAGRPARCVGRRPPSHRPPHQGHRTPAGTAGGRGRRARGLHPAQRRRCRASSPPRRRSREGGRARRARGGANRTCHSRRRRRDSAPIGPRGRAHVILRNGVARERPEGDSSPCPARPTANDPTSTDVRRDERRTAPRAPRLSGAQPPPSRAPRSSRGARVRHRAGARAVRRELRVLEVCSGCGAPCSSGGRPAATAALGRHDATGQPAPTASPQGDPHGVLPPQQLRGGDCRPRLRLRIVRPEQGG